MKRIWLVLLFVMLPALASAAVYSETISEGGGRLATIRHTFENGVPPAVADVLNRHGYADAVCVAGLALQRQVLQRPKGQENLYRYSDALVVLERNGARSLVGLRWADFTGESSLEDFGAAGLSLEKGAQLAFVDGPLHTVDYALTADCGGVRRTWKLGVASGNRWYIKACGDVVWNAGSGCFELDGEPLPACWTGCLRCRSFADFPVTAAQARAIAEGSWHGMRLDELMTVSANLRLQPTSQSASLGDYHIGVLAQRLDAAQGLHSPWYQVRVGNAVGWVSSPYAEPIGTWAGLAGRGVHPLPVRHTTGQTALFSAPGGDLSRTLPAGAMVQVLAETADGWLHVVIPECALIRWTDVNGVYGYIRRDEVKMYGL